MKSLFYEVFIEFDRFDMLHTRRRFLQGTSASIIAAGLPNTGYSRTIMGDMTVHSVSDGSLTLPGEFTFGPMPQDELEPILKKYNQSIETLLQAHNKRRA